MKIFNLKSTMMLLLGIGAASILNAQSYTITGPTVGQGPLLNTEGTSTSTGWVVIHDDIAHGGGSVNSWSTAVNIGFPFEFDGVPVTAFCVSKNYLLTFTTSVATTALPAAISTNNTALPNASLPDKTIAYLWCGFGNPAPLGTNDEVWSKTFGTAPNRQFWVKNFSYECENQSFTYNFVVLEETTNNIYVVDARNASAGTSTRTVGVQMTSSAADQDAASPNIASINANTVTPWPNVNVWTFAPVPPANDDVRLASIDGPASGCELTATETATVKIVNSGLNTQTSIPVTYSLNGGAFVSGGTWTGTLPHKDTATHTFTVNLSAIQTHNLVVATNLAADTRNSNDTGSAAIISAPTYNLFDTVTVCSGGSYTFPDATTQMNITAEVVHVSNITTVALSCDSVITTTVKVAPVYDETESALVCDGDTFLFPDGFIERDITAQVMHVSNLRTAGFNCDSIITTTVDIDPVDSTTSVSGATVTSNATGASYQWLDCGNASSPIAGETGQSFTATANGSYAVEVTTANGCVDTSECISFTTIGIADNVSGDGIQLYPNPTEGLVTIDLGKTYPSSVLQVLNLQGQLILEKQVENKQLIQLNINQPKGTYLLQIQNSEGTFREKVVIK